MRFSTRDFFSGFSNSDPDLWDFRDFALEIFLGFFRRFYIPILISGIKDPEKKSHPEANSC